MILSPLSPDTGMATQFRSRSSSAKTDNRQQIASNARLVVIDQVHLVDREHEAADADQLGEIGVAPGLGQDALARIDQQDREVGGRRTGHHVARILLVARRIGDDEFALRAGEEAIGDVDRDALLALRRQAVDEQREIDPLALRPVALAVIFERAQLVVENLLALVQQPPDQRRLAIVDAAAGDEAQQLLFSCWSSQARTSVRISSRSESSTRDIRNIPPASSSPCWRCPNRGRSPGPGAPRSWSAAFRRRSPRPSLALLSTAPESG